MWDSDRQTDSQTDSQTDGQTLFHKTLLATAGGLIEVVQILDTHKP